MSAIPIVEIYKGVGLHDQQDEHRLAVVRGEVDVVLAMHAPPALIARLEDSVKSPESRLLAAAKLEALFAFATERRVVRPAFDLDYVHACSAGLDSQGWRSPRVFGTLFDESNTPGVPGPPRRPVPLDE